MNPTDAVRCYIDNNRTIQRLVLDQARTYNFLIGSDTSNNALVTFRRVGFQSWLKEYVIHCIENVDLKSVYVDAPGLMLDLANWCLYELVDWKELGIFFLEKQREIDQHEGDGTK